MKRITLVWIYLTIFIGLFSQISDVLDPSRVFVEEWQDAGSSALKQVNEIEQFFLVTDYGLVGDGDTDNSAQLSALLLQTLDDRFSMLYFPEGTYKFNYSIQIDYDKVIIKGAGSDKTIFSFWLNEAPYFDPLFSVYNQSYVGFEDLYIWTSNQQNEGNPITIMLNKADNCWVSGVEMYRCIEWHIGIYNDSHHNTIVGCYLHGDWHSCGGEGYGIAFHTHGDYVARNNLIENNIVRHMRHAIVPQYCAWYNVFGYNYTTDCDGINQCIPCEEEDFDFHGHNGPKGNLVEGNNCDILAFDDEHDNNFELNTLFRNSADKFQLDYGGYSTQFSQNLIGNRFNSKHIQCTNWEYRYILDNEYMIDLFSTAGNYQELASNQVSYYYDSKPEFMPSYNWPYDPGTANPARARYDHSSTHNTIPAGWDHYVFDDPYSLDCYYYHHRIPFYGNSAKEVGIIFTSLDHNVSDDIDVVIKRASDNQTVYNSNEDLMGNLVPNRGFMGHFFMGGVWNIEGLRSYEGDVLVEIYHDGQFLISAQVPFDNDCKPPIHIPLKNGNGDDIPSAYVRRHGSSTYSEYLSLGCTARIYPNGVFDDNASFSYCISACIQKWEENRWQFVQTLDVVDNYIDLRNLNIGYDHALRLVLDGSMTCQGIANQRWFDRYRIGYSFSRYEIPIRPGNGGCPTLYVNGNLENTLLPFGEDQTEDVSESILLKTPIDPEDDTVTLKVVEPRNNLNYFDHMELMAVGHPKNVKIGLTTSGEVFGYSNDNIHCSNLRDLPFTLSEGDTLKVDPEDYDVVVDTTTYLVLTHCIHGFEDDDKGEVDALSGDDGDIVDKDGTHEELHTSYLEITDVGEDGAVDVVASDDIEIHEISIVKEEDLQRFTLDMEYCTIRNAVSKEYEDALHLLSNIDREHVIFSEGEGFEVVFEKPCVMGECVDYVVTSRGHYLHQDEDGGIVAPTAITMGNYPNPFNPETTISYNLPEKGIVEIDVFNIKGQKVRTLIHEAQEAGPHTVTWSGDDDSGKHVSSGVYLYRLKTERETITRKMLLLE